MVFLGVPLLAVFAIAETIARTTRSRVSAGIATSAVGFASAVAAFRVGLAFWIEELAALVDRYGDHHAVVVDCHF
jgi:hypothetical protein